MPSPARCGSPKLLICDEILSALDVSVQALIVELLRSLEEKHTVAILFVSHDLAVVQQLADGWPCSITANQCRRQMSETTSLLIAPLHPTEMLLEAASSLRKDGHVSVRRLRPC